jgi:signal peptide peptidase SppA
MAMRLRLLMEAFRETPWALQLGTFEAFSALLDRASAGNLSDDEISAAARSEKPPYAAAGSKENVAVIPVMGVIAHRAHLVQDVCGPGGTSTELLEQAIRAAAADPAIRAIVLDIDSPGGSVFGVAELADTIRQAREQKPIAAVANATAASAAYWIGSAAHELFVIPSGEVGSIGVYGKHEDTSKADEAAGKVTTIISAGKYKAEGAGPLTDDAKAHMQARVDAYYTQFVRDVAKQRGVSVEAVRSGYGQGRTLGADAALAAGMVDGIATLSEVISKYARRTTETANRSRALAEAQISIAAARWSDDQPAIPTTSAHY